MPYIKANTKQAKIIIFLLDLFYIDLGYENIFF